MGPTPSGTDVTTFMSTRFSRANHSFMAILGGNNVFSCRLRTLPANDAFPAHIREIPVQVHFSYLPDHLPRSEWTALHSALTHSVRESSLTISSPEWTPRNTREWTSNSLLNLIPELHDHHHLFATASTYGLNYKKIAFNGNVPLTTLIDTVIDHFDPNKHRVDLYAPHLTAFAQALLHPEIHQDAILVLPYLIQTDKGSILQQIRRTFNDTYESRARPADAVQYLDYLETMARAESTADITTPPPIPAAFLEPEDLFPPSSLPTRATPIPPTDWNFQ